MRNTCGNFWVKSDFPKMEKADNFDKLNVVASFSETYKMKIVRFNDN